MEKYVRVYKNVVPDDFCDLSITNKILIKLIFISMKNGKNFVVLYNQPFKIT